MWHKYLLIINNYNHVCYIIDRPNKIRTFLINSQDLSGPAEPIMLTIEFVDPSLAKEFYNKFLVVDPIYYASHRDYYKDLPSNVIFVSETFAKQHYECEDDGFYKIQINLSVQKHADLHKVCCYLKEDSDDVPEELLDLILHSARSLTDMEKDFYNRLDNRDIKEDLLDIAKTIISQRNQQDIAYRNNLTILWELSEACEPYSDLKIKVLKNIHESSVYYHKAQLELILCIRYKLLFIEDLSVVEYLSLIDDLADYIKNLGNNDDMLMLLEQFESNPDIWFIVLKCIVNTLSMCEPNSYITYLQLQNKELTEENHRLQSEKKLLQNNNTAPAL